MSEAPLYAELADAPETGQAFWLTPRGRPIRAAVWPEGARGTVLLFPGRTEYIEKYGRVIAAFAKRGFAVATIDWRGQGLSSRPLDDPMKGHVADFANYQIDVAALMASPAVAALPKPHVLVCHSMGGCIGMRALLDETVTPEAVVMTAPMLGFKLSPLMRLFARTIAAAADRFGLERRYAPTPHASEAYVLWHDFHDNLLTGDEEHFRWFGKHLEAEPDFALGAPTVGWMREAFAETANLRPSPPPEPPMLMFLGDREGIVDPAAIRAFDAKAPRCRLVDIDDCRHEAFMETPEIRRLLWEEIDRHLAAAGI